MPKRFRRSHRTQLPQSGPERRRLKDQRRTRNASQAETSQTEGFGGSPSTAWGRKAKRAGKGASTLQVLIVALWVRPTLATTASTQGKQTTAGYNQAWYKSARDRTRYGDCSENAAVCRSATGNAGELQEVVTITEKSLAGHLLAIGNRARPCEDVTSNLDVVAGSVGITVGVRPERPNPVGDELAGPSGKIVCGRGDTDVYRPSTEGECEPICERVGRRSWIVIKKSSLWIGSKVRDYGRVTLLWQHEAKRYCRAE